MDRVYELTHFYEDSEGYDIVTEIAVYTTMDKAQEAEKRLKKHPKFRDHPNDFVIDEYILDQDNWQDGFFTY